MGFDSGLILERGSLHSEFECAICMSLVEYPVYTRCSHVFCKSCLDEWLENKRNCPKCKEDLNGSDAVRDLKEAAPLANRILCRVCVKCPLFKQGCKWQGSYGDLNSHLSNSTTHVIDSKASESARRAQAVAQAEGFKEQGNQQFRARAYGRAIALYGKSIALNPNIPATYSNRASAYLALGRHNEAIADARAALKIDPGYAKGHRRLSRALVEKGEFLTAASHLERALPRVPELAKDHALAVQLAQGMADGAEALAEGKYMEAVSIFRAVSSQTRAAAPVLMGLRAELRMGRADHALRQSLQVIRADKRCADAYVVRGWALFLRADFEQSLLHLKEALRLDPDAGGAKTLFKRVRATERAYAGARKAFSQRDFERSRDLFGNAIQACSVSHQAPLWASLHAQRAQAQRRLKDFEAALSDCDVALRARDDNKSAWATRASALVAMGRAEEALKDMKELRKGAFEHDTIIKHWHDKAEFEVRKRKRPDYYGVLGVPSIASEPEIKAAYKKRALELHPDRVSAEGDEKKSKQHEEMFKVAGEALEVLTDPMKRKLYDDGHDKESIEERVRAAQRAAAGHGGHNH